MSKRNDLPFLVALHTVSGLGPIRLKFLLDNFDDNAQAIWQAPISKLKELKLPEAVIKNLDRTRQELSVKDYFNGILAKGIQILTIFDSDYPKLLSEIYDPPLILYYLGQFNLKIIGHSEWLVPVKSQVMAKW